MKLRYDPQVDAAYIRLVETEITDSEAVRPGIVLDYDTEDRLVGIEILNARQQLPDLDLTLFEQQPT